MAEPGQPTQTYGRGLPPPLPSPLASSFLACTSCVPSPMSSHPLPTRDRRTRAIEVLVSRGYAPSFLFQQSRDPFLLILSSPFLFVLLLFFFFFSFRKIAKIPILLCFDDRYSRFDFDRIWMDFYPFNCSVHLIP